MPCRLISRGKKQASEFLRKNILCWTKYRSWRKMLKKILRLNQSITHSPSNVQWSCQPFRGWGKKPIWHLEMSSINKMAGARSSCGSFQDQSFALKIENTPIKDTNGKRKFKRMLSFLFVDKRKLFAMKLSFEEFNLVFYTADRSAWLVLNQQGSEVNTFLKTLEVHSVLYDQRKVRF